MGDGRRSGRSSTKERVLLSETPERRGEERSGARGWSQSSLIAWGLITTTSSKVAAVVVTAAVFGATVSEPWRTGSSNFSRQWRTNDNNSSRSWGSRKSIGGGGRCKCSNAVARATQVTVAASSSRNCVFTPRAIKYVKCKIGGSSHWTRLTKVTRKTWATRATNRSLKTAQLYAN